MRYIVIGPGSVGGTVGGLLAHAGHDVVLVGRGPHLTALRAAGLTVLTPKGPVKVTPPVVAGPGELRLTADDALLLAVKSQDTVAVLDAWNCRPVDHAERTAAGPSPAACAPSAAPACAPSAAPACAPSAAPARSDSAVDAALAAGGMLASDVIPVFCLQNGVANERIAARRFAHVYGVGVQLPAEMLAPGRILAPGSPVAGVLDIGRYPAGTGTAAEQFAADLNGSGFVAKVTDRIMTSKYTKLLRNLRNAIVAACGSLNSESARRLAELAVAEAVACYRAAGIEYVDLRTATAARDEAIRELPVDGMTRGGVSSWQSLNRRSGSAEADYLNGEIVLLGRLHGVPTPVNELLRQVMKVLAEHHQPPGTVDADALAVRVNANGAG